MKKRKVDLAHVKAVLKTEKSLIINAMKSRDKIVREYEDYKAQLELLNWIFEAVLEGDYLNEYKRRKNS